VLDEEVMKLSQDESQRLVIFSAEPDSPSEAGLRLLTGLTAGAEQDRAVEQDRAQASSIRSAERS
jgi:hypothetical protein